MAKESYKVGDKVVLTDASLRSLGMWTVTATTQYLITVQCMVNGRTKEEFLGPSDIIRKIEKNRQLLLFDL